jgi:hypothetical protein
MAGVRNGTSGGLIRRRVAGVAAALGAAVAVFGLMGTSVRSAGDEAPLPPDLRRVPGDAVGFVSLRLADLWNQEAAKGVRERLAKDSPAVLDEWRHLVGLPPGDIERWTAVFPYLEVGPGPYPLFFVETARPYDRDKVLADVAPGAKEEKKGGQVLYVNGKGKAVHFIDDRAYVASSAGAVRELLERPAPKKEGRLVAALRLAAGKHALVVGVNPEPIVREIPDNLPGEAERLKPLLRTELVTLTVDADQRMHGEMRLTFPEEKDARQAQTAVKAGLALGQVALARATKELAREAEGGGPDAARFVELVKRAEADLKGLRVGQQGTHVDVTVDLKANLGDAAVALDEVTARVRQAAQRVESQNNLRQLTLAMHNYADRNSSRFPPQAVFSPEGKPLLSWRVLILPYLEEEALYKEFHLDEPWDSDHNKMLLAKMPKFFAMPGSPAGTTDTHYLAFVGKSAFFDGKKGLRMPLDFPDGTSNTIMFVEAPKGVPWTKPEDLPFDPDPTKPLPKLGGQFRDGFNVSLCDGSVRFLRKTISDTTLRSAITRDGGEVLGQDF